MKLLHRKFIGSSAAHRSGLENIEIFCNLERSYSIPNDLVELEEKDVEGSTAFVCRGRV